MENIIKKMVKNIFKLLGYDIQRNSKNLEILQGLPLPYDTMQNARLLPNRDFALTLLPKGGIVAEVGVAYGDFSRKIIDNLEPSKFYAIDIFEGSPGNELFRNRTDFTDLNLEHVDYIEKKYKAEINKGVFCIKKGFSWEVLSVFNDDYFDYVYLDAGHDYESVKKDITVLLNKVKDGGIIQFNDYIIYDYVSKGPYGVIKAVDELLVSGKHKILFFCLNPGSWNDIVVKINKK
ncbi:MAG: class I SAM-dependent methyltransferase [Treponema sp.]|jgi:hypothetical protein|nr:class I SAM-dependent methyltransferase [Treponema sp.]